MTKKRIARQFKKAIAKNGPTRETINAFLCHKRAKHKAMRKVVHAMIDYAWAIRDDHLLSETILLIDGEGIMERLSEVTKETCGPEVWEKVFGGREIPKVGATLDEINAFTLDTDKRFHAAAPRERYECACEQVAHCWNDAWTSTGPEDLRRLGSIDALVAHMNEQAIKQFETCRDKGEPFFNQMIDDDVIAHAKANPSYRREGDKLYVEKNPFQATEFLVATDSRMKRYYACHCPLARETILQADGPVSRSFCHCSLGYSKKPFEAAFGRELEGRTVSVVFDEDTYKCVFEIDIPDDILAEYT